MPGILDEKIALITGAGSGIGRATSRIFAREGARLVLADVAEMGGKRRCAWWKMPERRQSSSKPTCPSLGTWKQLWRKRWKPSAALTAHSTTPESEERAS